MKKTILVIGLILLVVIMIISYILANKYMMSKIAINNDESKKETLRIIPKNENTDKEQIVQSYIANASYLIDMSNNEVIADKADAIIIGKITDIDGYINYNPTTKNYVMARTIGNIKVKKVLKGDIKEKNIPFIRVGGTILISEYEKSLQEKEKEKQGINKLTKQEKESKYISQSMGGDISIEENKTYLIYLNYAKDYERYSIQFLQYGLREIDEETLSSDTEILTQDEYKTIKVKNNQGGEYEVLDGIIPKTVRKNI